MPTTVTPHLVCTPAKEALAFYEKAFGATIGRVTEMPGGGVMHAEISIDGAPVWLADDMMGGAAATGGTPITLHLYVDDCDKVYEQAVAAGATATMPLEDQFWGDRYGQVQDPYGHTWAIATHKSDPTPEEMQKAMAAMAPQG